jgi:uncharacterized membrane protein YgcG
MPRLALIVVAIAFTVAAVSAPAAAARDRALDRKLPETKFTGVTFGDAVDYIRDVGGVNIHVNWKALELQNVTADTPVNIHLRSVSLRKVLTLLLSEASGSDTLTFFVDQGVVEITTRELADKKVYTKIYPVDDLVMEIPQFTEPPSFSLQSSSDQGGRGGGGGGGSGGGSGLFSGGTSDQNRDQLNTTTREQRGEELVTLVTETVRPDIWAVNGGTATIRYFRGNLIVTAPRSVHEALGG